MLRSSVGARLAGVGAATLLVAGLFAQAAPTLAASPQHALPAGWGVGHPATLHRSPRTIDVGALIGHSKVSLPFDATAASAALGSMEAKDRAARQAAAPTSNVAPAVVAPSPDPVTASGAAAPTTPVAVGGQTEPLTGIVEPANPGIAVGPDDIVQADNNSLLFTDRAGNTADTFTLPFFFGLPETFGYTTWDSDAEVHFDTLRQRWVASELSWDCAQNTFPGDDAVNGHGYIDYAISDTSDPLGKWTFDAYGWKDVLPDRPAFGTSTDKFAFSTNWIQMGAGGSTSSPGCTSGSFLQTEIIIEDWSQLGPKFDIATIVPEYFQSAGPDLRFAVQEPVTSPELRMINADITPLVGNVDYVFFAGSAKAHTVTVGGSDLTATGVVPAFGASPSPHQPGGTLTTAIDGQPDSVIYHNGTLAFTANYPCTPTGDTFVRNCVRVVTLGNTVASAAPTRLGDTLIGTNGFDDSFGGIGWSGNGALHVVYTRSSATSDASSYEQYHLSADASSAWSAPHVLSTGTAAYAGTQWGGDTTVATDPQEPTAVWAGDPYANASGGWSTKIHEIVVGGAGAGYFPLIPIRILDSRSSSLAPRGFSGALAVNTPRTFQVTGVTINGETVPTGAVAITGNLTVTGQTAAGYVSLTPTPTANPTSSTLNFPVGDNRANNVTIALAPNGSLAVIYKAASGTHTHVLLDVTGYFFAGLGQTYHPLSPDRVLDSRSDPVTHAFAANVSKHFPVAGVLINGVTIPSAATAITANLTVTGQTKAGYVSLTPALDNNPLTSTLNFPVGDNRANGLTIPLNVDGTLAAVYKAASGTANLILDVTGYYSNAGGGLLFHPLNPGRRVDTRLAVGVGGLGNGLAGAQGTTPRSVGVEDHFGVPVGAAAITGNLTITAQTGAGYVSVTDALVAHPGTSTINFPLGDTRANGITAPLGSGDLWFVYQVLVGKHVHLTLDITGYFE